MAKNITQRKLAAYLKSKQKVEKLQAELKATEESLLAELQAGTTVQVGLLTARVKEWQRRNVAWKQVLIREKGEDFADRVFNATRPDDYVSLVVELG